MCQRWTVTWRWVVISGVVSSIIIKGTYNPLITTHEPPSRQVNFQMSNNIASWLAPRTDKLILLLMIEILHYLKDPKLWELWYIPYYG